LDKILETTAKKHYALAENEALNLLVLQMTDADYDVEITVDLNGAGAAVNIWGVYFASANQRVVNKVVVNHNAPNCASNVLYKGALQGQNAQAFWDGFVYIGKDATGTDTYEANRNLLLTPGTRALSVPNLEILTGEIVRAGHASATGRFDDDQLFYLMSRGIDAKTAKRLIVEGFFEEVVNFAALDENYRAEFAKQLERKIDEGR
jgi:Fe-S cluster assembly protein SufD